MLLADDIDSLFAVGMLRGVPWVDGLLLREGTDGDEEVRW